MVAITWTPKIIDAIKEIKKLDKSEIASHFKDRKYMDSFCLSYQEKQAVTSIFSKNEIPASTQSWWY